MDCREARDLILQSDDPARPDAPGLAGHVAHCDACGRLAADLARLEQAWRDLPTPPDADRARADFLARLAARPGLVAGEGRRRRGAWLPRRLVAASVLLALGLGVGMLASMRRAAASSDVVERLVDWNLALTRASSPTERGRIYAGRAATLEGEVRRARLPEDERALAESLLENGPWLAREVDPLAEADRFDEVAARLFDRVTHATRRGDARRAARYARLYSEVAALGIDAKLEALQASGALDFHRRRRLERLILRDTDRMEALRDLLERAPNATRKEIRQALKVRRKPVKKKAPAPGPAGSSGIATHETAAGTFAGTEGDGA